MLVPAITLITLYLIFPAIQFFSILLIEATTLGIDRKIKISQNMSSFFVLATVFVAVFLEERWGFDAFLGFVHASLPFSFPLGLLFLFLFFGLILFAYIMNSMVPSFFVNRIIRKVKPSFKRYSLINAVNYTLYLIQMMLFGLIYGVAPLFIEVFFVRLLVIAVLIWIINLAFTIIGQALSRKLFGGTLELFEAKQTFVAKARDYFSYPLDDIYIVKNDDFQIANAWVYGYFRPKITMTSTLVNNLTQEEVLAVLGHEIGHVKMRHLLKNSLLSIGALVFALWLMLDVLSPIFSNIAGLEFVEFILVIGSYYFCVIVLPGFMSRKNEFEADEFASSHIPDARDMVQALIKIAQINNSRFEGKTIEEMMQTHPFFVNRISHLAEKFQIDIDLKTAVSNSTV
ncbi:MAG: M48 family metallopeptidase [Chloroflexota bacterium]